jgi:DNA repair protein RecN (Recombination protein N)
MLRRLSLQDVAIVRTLDIELGAGFTVLTGETGAGKSILIEALQLALGARAEASLVREGAARAEVSAEFDLPETLTTWLTEAGFDDNAGTLLLRRTVDATGKSRAWVNGSAATLTQLREVAEHLVDIHGQHAWQSLTRASAVRTLLDAQAGANTATLASHWLQWRQADKKLASARAQRDTLAQERERLSWQIGEVSKLAPGCDEWETLNAEHQRLSHGQALLDAARLALKSLSDDDLAADVLCNRFARRPVATARCRAHAAQLFGPQ